MRIAQWISITIIAIVQTSVNASPMWSVVAFGDSTTAPANVSIIESGRPAGIITSQGENILDVNNPRHNVVNMVDQDSGKLYTYSDVLRDESVAVNVVDNEGIPGRRTDQALWNGIMRDVLAKNADIVVVQYGINDSWVDNSVQGPSRVAIDAATQIGHPFSSRGNYTDNLTEVVQILKDDGIRVILMTPNQLYPAQTQSWWRNDLLGTYAQVVRDVALTEDVELLDVWKIYEDHGNIDDLLFDSMHPNGLGHQMIAQGLENIIVSEMHEHTIVPEPSVLLLLGIGIAIKHRGPSSVQG